MSAAIDKELSKKKVPTSRSASEVACVVADPLAAGGPRRREAALNDPRTVVAASTPNIFRSAGLSLILVSAICGASARACPMCKESTVDTTQPAAVQPAGLDFNRSIYIMLGGFAGLVGMTGTVIVKAARSRL
jgi:hypothetical protein